MTVYAVVLIELIVNVILYHEVHVSRRYKKSIIIFGSLLLLLVSGLRYYVGTDYINYMNNYFRYTTESFSSFLNLGLFLVARMCSVTIDDYATWFFIMAAITVLPIAYVVVKYAAAPELSILFYVLLGCWHFSFNLVKQCAAASIVFLGYSALIKKNFKLWVIFCLIASLFHVTALLMIPLYFVSAGNFTIKKSILIIIIGALVFRFYDALFDLAFFLKQGEGIVGQYSATRNDSVNILRVLVNFIPITLLLFFGKSINFQDKKVAPLVNMTMLNGALNLGAMQSIYLYRFCCYTNIFNILLLPIIIKSIERRNRIILVPIILIIYFVFWWYDLEKGSSTNMFYWIFER